MKRGAMDQGAWDGVVAYVAAPVAAGLAIRPMPFRRPIGSAGHGHD